MSDEDLMPFGKYKGRKLIDVPASYLLYLWDNGVWAERDHVLHSYLNDNLEALAMDAPDIIVIHPPK